MLKFVGVFLIGCFLLPALVFAASSENYCINQVVVNSAGATRTATGRSLHDSMGEPVIGQTQTEKYTIQAGFFSEYILTVLTPTATPLLTATVVVPNTYLKVLHSQINPNQGEQAVIRWAQPQAAPLTLTIYNLAGDKIRTLVNNQTYAANVFQEVKWDGRSADGETVGSGIYIVHLKTQGFETHCKIAVVK